MKAVTAKKKTDGNWIPINFFFRFALQKCHWHRAAHPTPVYIYCTCRMSWVWLIWRSSACPNHWGAGVFMYCFRLVWQNGFGSASQEPFWTSAEILVRFLQSPNRNVSWEEKKWNKKATLVASPAGLQLGFFWEIPAVMREHLWMAQCPAGMGPSFLCWLLKGKLSCPLLSWWMVMGKLFKEAHLKWDKS